MTELSTQVAPPASAARRIRRLMGGFIGGGYVAYFLVSIPEIRADAVIVAPWWTPLAVALAYGPGGALLAASLNRHPRWLDTAIPLACGCGYLGALVLWFFAWDGTQIPGPRTTWLVVFPGLVSLSLVLSRWPWLACLQLLISIPGVFLANALARSDTYNTWATVGDLTWAWTFSAVFVLAGIMAVRTGDILDATRELVADAAARTAEQQARDAERTWYKLLTHDWVLAVLQNVRHGSADPQVARWAQRAMDELDAGSPHGDAVAIGLMPLMRAVIADIDINIAVTGQPPLRDDIHLPPPVVRELVAAAAEAVRNCVRHAGPGATIAVHVESDAARVRITVIDNGKGFDPGTVREDRIGLSFSIQRRMTAVGGRATIDTRPGAGTRIFLDCPA